MVNFGYPYNDLVICKDSTDYLIEDHKLLEVAEQADLGIIISNDLKPSKHIAKVASKANQRLDMSRRCFSNHSSDVIKPLYQAVRPIINPCSAAPGCTRIAETHPTAAPGCTRE